MFASRGNRKQQQERAGAIAAGARASGGAIAAAAGAIASTKNAYPALTRQALRALEQWKHAFHPDHYMRTANELEGKTPREKGQTNFFVNANALRMAMHKAVAATVKAFGDVFNSERLLHRLDELMFKVRELDIEAEVVGNVQLAWRSVANVACDEPDALVNAAVTFESVITQEAEKVRARKAQGSRAGG